MLHLNLPANAVDVNVHPAKTEVKFLSEKTVFDCVHYGVLGALNKQPDRPQVKFKQPPAEAASAPKISPPPPKKEPFFRTMTPAEYKTFSAAVQSAPAPKPERAQAAAAKLPDIPLRETVILPQPAAPRESSPTPPVPVPPPQVQAPPAQEEAVQTVLPMPEEPTWRYVGELYRTYIIVEEGDNAFLIDKHAAHERILFEKLKANQEGISSQTLLTPLPVRLSPSAAGELLANRDMLDELGFEIEEFGDSTLLLRQIPMDLQGEDAADALEALAADLLNGRREHTDTVRDALLHTVACKAAIKAGWHSDERELKAIAREVMGREELKYCPHGRPICVNLSKKALEKQFKRS